MRVLSVMALVTSLAVTLCVRSSVASPQTDVQAFLNDVFARLPTSSVNEYSFQSWRREGRPTSEGFGLLPSGVDGDALIARVMDVDHYVGNIDHVTECHTVADSRYSPPETVRFYQRIEVPLLGDLHHELVLVDGGTRNGYRYAYWYILEAETAALSADEAVRSDYSMGAWIVGNGMLGYALSSAPMRGDVSWLKWKLLTTGADLTAASVVKGNLEGMSRWAR